MSDRCSQHSVLMAQPAAAARGPGQGLGGTSCGAVGHHAPLQGSAENQGRQLPGPLP